jgi:hypothetical protein
VKSNRKRIDERMCIKTDLKNFNKQLTTMEEADEEFPKSFILG